MLKQKTGQRTTTSFIIYRVMIISYVIYSGLSWFCTARGSSAGLCWVSPTKVEARKPFPFTQSSFQLKIRND